MASTGLKFLVGVVLLSFFGGQVDCKVERFAFHIVEKGTPVIEEVDVDVEQQTEVFRVPQHNDVDPMELMNDFAAGLSVRRVPSTKDCYVFQLNPSLPSPQKLKLDMDQASKQRLPDKVIIKKTTTRVLGFANHSALPQRILDFCGSFPIYNAEEISLDLMNASFHKSQGLGRKKRHHIRMEYHLCSSAARKQLNACLKKLGGFKFQQKCTYKLAHCYYIVDCSHDPKNTYSRKYFCDDVVHRINYESICCEAIC